MIRADGGFSPPNPSVFSGIRLFILIYQKIAVLCLTCATRHPYLLDEHHHVYRQKDDVAYSFHIALAESEGAGNGIFRVWHHSRQWKDRKLHFSNTFSLIYYTFPTRFTHIPYTFPTMTYNGIWVKRYIKNESHKFVWHKLVLSVLI